MDLKNASLKQKLVLILGIAYILLHLVMETEDLLRGAPPIYMISVFIQYNAMAAAMILITFKKKTPALVLTISALVLCLVNQYLLTYGSTDPFYRTLYYLLEYFLLIAYILVDDSQKKNSLLWCGLFLFAVGYSVYEIAEFLTLRDAVFLLLYLSFYLVGYSPEKWYERKA